MSDTWSSYPAIPDYTTLDTPRLQQPHPLISDTPCYQPNPPPRGPTIPSHLLETTSQGHVTSNKSVPDTVSPPRTTVSNSSSPSPPTFSPSSEDYVLSID